MMDTFVSSNEEATRLLKELAALVDPFNLPTLPLKCHEQLNKLIQSFNQYVDSKAENNPNWSFWSQFVQLNCFAYIAHFCSVRSGNWNLRLEALKTMAPIYCAFDSPIYRKLIPQYLADCILLPSSVRESFSQGGFSVITYNRQVMALSRAG